jgi:hypothetical protein
VVELLDAVPAPAVEVLMDMVALRKRVDALSDRPSRLFTKATRPATHCSQRLHFRDRTKGAKFVSDQPLTAVNFPAVKFSDG